jgi:hypothetical protein
MRALLYWMGVASVFRAGDLVPSWRGNLVFGDGSALLQGSFPSLYKGFLTFDYCCSDTWRLVN